ncbi:MULTISPECIES: hypothetical protein [Bacillus]|uniref:Uncharacterized protein n=2 Tax=Bacillus thuringiensis TaxID=1428 RepID=A0AAP4Q8T5_BACTU|nr:MULTISPECIES: hypothetical protein [Bacillus]AFV21994.1 hypothetical protein BTB_502p06890 [Bacillus thuringiensis Bt407]EEM24985.1 hypothetical protein bthur0002_56270 [Bacillus thuringiensis Bt407]ERI00828.1 hypothetical protein BTCBT_002383 [Bacillus thuringiensis T01-328]MBN6707609.1 hypothetical protein [Bacillus thuringiensis]MDF9599475.1 hypothetical protein [Bacillus cereus]
MNNEQTMVNEFLKGWEQHIRDIVKTGEPTSFVVCALMQKEEIKRFINKGSSGSLVALAELIESIKKEYMIVAKNQHFLGLIEKAEAEESVKMIQTNRRRWLEVQNHEEAYVTELVKKFS